VQKSDDGDDFRTDDERLHLTLAISLELGDDNKTDKERLCVGISSVPKRRLSNEGRAVFSPVRGWTSLDWTGPGLVQYGPRIFRTGIGPV
jgi:hypothetical protein